MNTPKADWAVENRPGPENGRPGPGVSRYSRPGPSLSGPVWGSNCSEEKKNLCVFFSFQAILNTFYFWVKNLEKKYSKSQEDTPPPHNWKNILYLYFMFHAILSTFKFFWKNKYLIGTDGPVKFLPARSDFVVFILLLFFNKNCRLLFNILRIEISQKFKFSLKDEMFIC